MKKTILFISMAILSLTILSSCAHEKRFDVGNNETIIAQPYGLVDAEDVKMDTVHYEVSVGNVIWSIVGFETGILPIWLIGWDLYKPTRLKTKEEYLRAKS